MGGNLLSEQLDTGRAYPRAVVLTDRLARALQKLNPWLTEDNRNSAVHAVAGLQAASLIEASEKLHTTPSRPRACVT